MFYRETELLASTYKEADGTQILDVDLLDPISRITVLAMPRAGSWPVLGHPAECFTKIEVINGADILFSMSGIQVHALDFYDNKRMSLTNLSYLQGACSICALHLNFGRYLWDEELALDPSQFKNLQMKLSFDIDAGGATTDRLYFRVFADVFDEKTPSLRGFLMSKEIEDVSITASAYSYVDLPTDYLMRKIMMESRADADGPVDQYEMIKLSSDQDKHVIYDIETYDLIRCYMGLFPKVRESGVYAATTTARNFDWTPGHEVNAITGGAQDVAAYGAVPYLNGCEGTPLQNANCQAIVQVEGWCPHNAVPLLLGKQDVIEDWFDVTALGNLKLRLRHGAGADTTKTVGVVTQQMRHY